MTAVLDDLAEALHAAQGSPLPRRIAASVELRQQFGLPITPSRWAALTQQLRCSLPPLERRSDGLWWFPRGWTTVWDVAGHLAERCANCELPLHRSAEEWRNAQVFAGVRACLMTALNVPAEEVVRAARLGADLGAE
jgi:hypothetical protein